MSNLSNRLYAWALNEEMIDTHLTEHGCDCVSASELLVQQDAEVESLRKELEREKQEHDRCTTFHAIAVKERNYERVLALQRDAEIKRLHGEMELMRLMDEPTLSAIEKRDNEIERLRQLLGDSEQLQAEIRGRKVELDSLRKDFGDLYDEVERLRALVRDIYDRHDLGSALDARMREALGE